MTVLVPALDPVPTDPVARATAAALAAAERRGDPPPAHLAALFLPAVPERHELPRAATRLPSVDDLVRLATDMEPDCGDHGPELVLGPWADLPHPARTVALAWCAWIAPTSADPTPLERATRDKGLGPARRAALHALSRAPTGLFHLVRAGDGWEVAADLLDLGAAAPAAGPIAVPAPIIALDGSEPRWVAGRVARDPEGWTLVAPIAVPVLPDLVARSWPWTVAFARLVDPTVQTRADVARRCGHRLTRHLLTALWKNDG